MEISDVRRRLRSAIEAARREAGERRERADVAARAYALFLEERAVPTFHAFAAALVAEGFKFKVFTPAQSVRLAYEGVSDDYIEVELDTAEDPPRVLGRTSRARGRRSTASERPLRARAAVADLTDEDVLEFLLQEITPFI